MTISFRRLHKKQHQRGVALYVVVVFALLSMLLALWASRTALFNELLVGNDADYQRAFEAAQALLQDAELDIRGENTDGTACVNANCRNKQAGATQIPAETQDVTKLLTTLDNQATKCLHGLCTKRTGRQDFWNYTAKTSPAPTDLAAGEVKLEEMTKQGIGARFGQYTGAVRGSADSSANPLLEWTATSPDSAGGWYWIEVIPYDQSSNYSGVIIKENAAETSEKLSLNLAPNVVYRVTALAYGRKPGTMAVLQQTYARQIAKD